jgi:hypothetical protein
MYKKTRALVHSYNLSLKHLLSGFLKTFIQRGGMGA